MRCRALTAALLILASLESAPQRVPDHLSPEHRAAIDEHVYAGLPATQHVYIRRGYILGYNLNTRTPAWVAYSIVPEYRNTPRRDGPFERLRDDPDISNEPDYNEYRGLFDARGYARGHLAPYAAMGGDRDGDGRRAEYHKDDPENIGDADDARTVFEANYMSNIVPQHHTGFNGGGRFAGEHRPGLWYELERWIQDELVTREKRRVWIVAGCIFGPGEHERVGPNRDIAVPPMFYKIVVYEEPGEPIPVVLAYLFPHQRVRHGDLEAFLVSVDIIEALSGLDFFHELDDLTEFRLEDTDSWLHFHQRRP